MSEFSIDLDDRRGSTGRQAAEMRRTKAPFQAQDASLRARQFETTLFASASADWAEAAEKAACLLQHFAESVTDTDPRMHAMIAAVLADFDRLSRASRPEP